jgi:hypothetical protein
MASEQQIADIDRAIQYEQPGKKEMPAPTGREVLIGRDRHPGGKTALRQVPVLIARGPENSGRVERFSQYHSHALDRIVAALARCQREQRPVKCALNTPVQRRMGVEYLQAAHQKKQETERVRPMRDAHQKRVAIDYAVSRWSGLTGIRRNIVCRRSHPQFPFHPTEPIKRTKLFRGSFAPILARGSNYSYPF